MDTILGIPLYESYSGIRMLAIYLCALIYTNKLSGAVTRETVVELTSRLV
jgi:hypothetical protein